MMQTVHHGITSVRVLHTDIDILYFSFQILQQKLNFNVVGSAGSSNKYSIIQDKIYMRTKTI